MFSFDDDGDDDDEKTSGEVIYLDMTNITAFILRTFWTVDGWMGRRASECDGGTAAHILAQSFCLSFASLSSPTWALYGTLCHFWSVILTHCFPSEQNPPNVVEKSCREVFWKVQLGRRWSRVWNPFTTRVSHWQGQSLKVLPAKRPKCRHDPTGPVWA